MGGIFSSPAPPPPPPPPPPPEPDPAEDERKARLDALDRRRRGWSGTVATGFRGVLQSNSGNASNSGSSSAGGTFGGKTLLGE